MLKCQFDVDLPPDDTSLIRYMMFVFGAVAVLAFIGSFVFICWWGAHRRQTALHDDSKANCPGTRHRISHYTHLYRPL